jgi:hypothetical protein
LYLISFKDLRGKFFELAMFIPLLSLVPTNVIAQVRPETPSNASGQGSLSLTPFGYFPSACVHGVPSRSEIVDNNTVVQPTKVRITFASCQIPATSLVPSTTSEDHEYAYFYHDPITFLSGKWTVPSSPTKNIGQTIFLWDGLQPSDGASVVQPVLQYGKSADGGGPEWICASWYVKPDTSTVFWSTPINVSVGDSMLGQLTHANSNWYPDCQDLTASTETELTVNHNMTETYAPVELETYSVTKCSELPATGSTSFHNLGVQVGLTPSWIGEKYISNWSCGQSVDVVSSQKVILYY